MKIKSTTYLFFSWLLCVTSSCLNEELDYVPFLDFINAPPKLGFAVR